MGREYVVSIEKQLAESRSRVIEAIAQNMNLYGITPSVGRLYGALYFSEEPLTLDDMTDVLGMSKTSMSTAIRTLADLKMVEKVWRKGIRKDLYVVQDDWYQTFTELFTIKWRSAISVNINAINKSIEEMKLIVENNDISDNFKKTILEDIEKLSYALSYYDWLNRLVDSFESKEIFNYVPKNK